MSDSSRHTRRAKEGSTLDFTQAIRRLKIPEDTVPDIDELTAAPPQVLLIARDADTKKWAQRWLERERLQVVVADDPNLALGVANELQPNVVVVEGTLKTRNGRFVVCELANATTLSAPLIVLSAGAKDLAVALEADVFDIVRKPYEWRLLGNRARRAAQAGCIQAELTAARASLAEALDIADGARRELRSQESFEPVTGLPNKRKFADLLRRGAQAVDREGSVMAVFVIGFNRFRLVIEALGQDSADLVLHEIGKNLSACLHDVGRMQKTTPGLRTSAAANIDQARFAMMMTCSGDQDDLTILQQQLVERLSRPVHIAGQAVYLSACVGVALYPQDADGVDSLLQRADNAMRDAQARGGGFKFYCPETDAAAARKLKLEHMLHEALNNGDLTLAYQPIVDTNSGRVDAVEALLRWRQSDDTWISPTEFVPIAEESGLMNRVGEFVLEEACRQVRIWRDNGFAIPRVCVNVSKVQLMRGDFPRTVRRILDEMSLEPSNLELELSERGVLSGDYNVISQLHEIKDLGVRLSVDDFGTGDSAIAYLRELPVDVLKIDRSYIDGLTRNRKDAAIISAMVALGHSLDLTIVAEGVETAEQRELLRELGCDYLQGFFTSAPVSADEVAQGANGSSTKTNKN